MENYFNTKNKKLCNGCGACAQKCPKRAIKMIEDEEGFLYPYVDGEKCIKCGLCERVCSNFNESKEKSKIYIAINKNNKELEMSSSGGMFYILAKYIIANKGIVFGVAYDEELRAITKYANTLEECKKFCGSKYVRSDLKNTYQEVKKFLQDGKLVLYTGTSCQINGLKNFLGQDYQGLILCDIICHANPSPRILELYKKNLEKIYKNKVKDIKFRSKENGWKNQTPIIFFENGKKVEEKTFYRAFAKELINRPSCSNCVFASKHRVSDFTIGDLWGIEKIDSEIDYSRGVSLFMLNSKKGNKILDKISDEMILKEVDFEKIEKYNHFHNVKENKNRKKFFEQIELGKINENNIIKKMNSYTKESLMKKIVKKIKKQWKKN